MSRLGLVFCLVYAVAIAACLAFAFAGAGDAKGQFAVLQLPIAVQAALLEAIGLGLFLERLSWVAAYAVLALPTMALLYLVGAVIDSRR